MFDKLKQFKQELKKQFASVDAYFDDGENFRVWKDTMERVYCYDNVDTMPIRFLTKERMESINGLLNKTITNNNKQ